MGILQNGTKGFGLSVSSYEMNLVDGLPFDICSKIRRRGESLEKIEEEKRKKEREARLDYYRGLAEQQKPLEPKDKD